MLTDSMVDGFVALAGDGFRWDGVKGTSRPASTVRKALRDDLLTRQGGICVQCGQPVTEGQAVEFCHVVARGPMVKGFIAGNVFAGHATCNTSTKPLYDDEGNLISGIEVLRPGVHILAPEAMVTEWTPFPVLKLRARS